MHDDIGFPTAWLAWATGRPAGGSPRLDGAASGSASNKRRGSGKGKEIGWPWREARGGGGAAVGGREAGGGDGLRRIGQPRSLPLSGRPPARFRGCGLRSSRGSPGRSDFPVACRHLEKGPMSSVKAARS